MAPTTIKIPVTSYQRFMLVDLSHGANNRITAKDGKRYRRFTSNFGLTPIMDALRKHGSVPSQTAADETPALVEVTIESVEYALKLAKLERSAQQEDVLGPLFDILELVAAGLPYEAPELPMLDAALEALKWVRPVDGGITNGAGAEA